MFRRHAIGLVQLVALQIATPSDSYLLCGLGVAENQTATMVDRNGRDEPHPRSIEKMELPIGRPLQQVLTDARLMEAKLQPS